MRAVEVAVLGPLEIRDGGRVFGIGAAKQRAVLALLALRAGRTVAATELIDALWWEDSPASATKTVQMYISSLRRRLGPPTIETTPGGYRLALTPDAVDVSRFEELARSGRRWSGDDPARAADALRRALALWRGEPFPELAVHPPGRALATRLKEMRDGCEEELADIRLRQGEHRTLVPELEAAVADHPLQERRWGQLMLALYRSGRQADALRAYQRMRSALVEALGVEPAPEIRALEQAVLAQDPALDLAGEPILGAVPDPTPAGVPVPDAADAADAADPASAHPADTSARETVAVLFTDMVSSTALSSRLDVDAAHEFRRNHLALLARTVDEHEGTQVKSLGDGIMAVFGSPSAALSCAVALQQGVDHGNRGASQQAAVRIGISAGEVVREDGDYFGDPVVEAARLCAVAEGGTILVAELIRLMAGRRAAHDFSPVGALVLKGLPEAVPTARLNWLPLPPDDPAVPFPHALSSCDDAFVGRVEERARLRFALEQASVSPVLAFVSGEPGIGKTALGAVMAREALASGWSVLYGRCDEDLRLPYQPFVEALSHLVTHAPSDVLADHVAEFGGELVRLAPTLARRVADCPAPSITEPDAERYLTFGAVAGLLNSAARWSPLMLILDDLHWADKATLLLLRFLAEHLEAVPTFVVGTYRSSEVTPTHPLNDMLPWLHRSTELTEVGLSGLREEEVVALARAAAGSAFDHDDPDLARAIRRETAGNPFFVLEVLRHLTETRRDGAGTPLDTSGPAPASAPTPPTAIELPPSVRAVVAQRVRRLGPDAGRILETAAVLGATFELDTLHPVLEDDPPSAVADGTDLLAAMELAVQAALIVEQSGPESRFAFAHALVQTTLYSGLSAARRARIHRRAAEVFEARPDLDAPTKIRVLAHHWDRAGDHPKALHYARRAGELALEDLAPDEAVRWFEHALRIQEDRFPGDTALRCDLMIRLGSAQREGGDAGYRGTLLDAGALARVIGDGTRMAEAALACYRGFWSSAGQVDEQKVDALEVAIAYLGDEDSATRARLLATLANELTFCSSLERRRPLVDEAVAVAERIDDPATMVPVLTAAAGAIWVPSTAEERLAVSGLAIELAEQLDDPVALFYANNIRLQAVTVVARIDESDKCLARLDQLSHEVGQPTLQWVSAFAHACRALLAGDPTEAERLNDQALALGIETGQPDALILYGATLTYVRWQQGRMGEVVPLVLQAARDNPGIPSYWGGVAWALAETGDSVEAARVLDAGATEGFTHLPDDSLQLPGFVMYAEAAIRLGERHAAAQLYDVLLPWQDQLSYMGVGVDGPVDHFLGGLAAVLGRSDVAESHLGRALEMSRSMGAQFFLARTILEWARALASWRRPGDEERAMDLARQAEALAGEHGYPLVGQRAGALAARLHG